MDNWLRRSHIWFRAQTTLCKLYGCTPMVKFISLLSQPEIQQFIIDNEQSDVQKLVLRHNEILGVPSSWIAQQILGRRKAKQKLPKWYDTPGIIYPPSVNMEQCSSEVTAKYKQSLVGRHHAADLTGGFGVDTFFLSKKFYLTEYVEPDESLLPLVRHNLSLLGVQNIVFHPQPVENFLANHTAMYDLLYLDPSRRQSSRKVFRFADCTPDVIKLRSKLLKRSPHLLIKASPLMDLKQSSRELNAVDQFIVLAAEGECKELLISLRREKGGEPTIHAVDLDREGEPTPFAFTWSQEKKASVDFSAPRAYLYEPNLAIMKAGAFKLVGQRFGLYKLGPDTHLYTAEEKINSFPGRIFKVVEEVGLDRKLVERFAGGFANILTRNYPLSVDAIKKKSGLAEGGTRYLIATKTTKNVVLVADRLR